MNKELINIHYDDCYFSNESGFLESNYVFIQGNNLNERDLRSICIGETGFGTGLNLLVLEDFLLKKEEYNIKVTYTSVEKYPLTPEAISNALFSLEEVRENAIEKHMFLYNQIYLGLKQGWNSVVLKREWGELSLNLFIGDISDSFKEYPIKNDCWFLDGHSPDKNPDMWSLDVFKDVAKNSKTGTTFATFTSAGIVKRALREAGFFVKRKKGFGKKRHMIFGLL